MEKLLEFWNARNTRERTILGVGGAVAICLLFYLAIWDPIQSDRQRLLREVPKLRAQVDQFRRDAEEAEALRTRAKSRNTSQALPSAIEASAKQANLGAFKSIQPMGTDRAQVSAGAVSFDELVRWIGAVGQKDGIVVDSLQASASTEPGRIQLDSLVLKR